MFVCVIISAADEEQSIGRVVSDVRSALQAVRYSHVIVVVDDHSTDKTSENAACAGAHVVRNAMKKGLARSFATGVKEARKLGASIVAHIDGDSQYTARDLLRLIDGVVNGYDLVIGYRHYVDREAMSRIRWIGGRALNFLASVVADRRFRDAQSGLRAFSADVARFALPCRCTYTQSQAIAASRFGFRLAEMPVSFNRRLHGKTRFSPRPLLVACQMILDIACTLRWLSLTRRRPNSVSYATNDDDVWGIEVQAIYSCARNEGDVIAPAKHSAERRSSI